MFSRKKKSDFKNMPNLLSGEAHRKKLEKIVNEEIDKDIGLEKGQIYYILYQVRDDDLNKIRQLIEQSVSMLDLNDVIVSTLMSSIVLMYFAINDEKAKENQLNLSKQLITAMGINIKLVYGNVNGAVGLIGTTERLSHGPIIPNLAESINELAKLDYGKFVEVKNK